MTEDPWPVIATCLAHCLDKEFWTAIDHLREEVKYPLPTACQEYDAAELVLSRNGCTAGMVADGYSYFGPTGEATFKLQENLLHSSQS